MGKWNIHNADSEYSYISAYKQAFSLWFMLAATARLLISFAISLDPDQDDKMSVLIWIQIIWHSDNVPERIFWKKNRFWKKSADDNKSMKNYLACKELRDILKEKNV